MHIKVKLLQNFLINIFISSLLISGSSLVFAEEVEMTDAERVVKLEERQREAELKRALLDSQESDFIEEKSESSSKVYLLPQRRDGTASSKSEIYPVRQRSNSDNFGQVRGNNKSSRVVRNVQESSARVNRENERRKFKSDHSRLNTVLNRQSRVHSSLNRSSTR